MTSRRTYERIARNLPFPDRKERVAVIYLGSRGAKFTQFVGSNGDQGTARFDIGDVVARAQRIKAAGIVLVHYHPSGALRASPQDRKVTRDLAQACQAAGVDLVDHLVYAGGKVLSIKGHRFPGNATVSDIPHRTMDHRKEVHVTARRIRKEGEKYPQALKRAWQQMKETPHWSRATLPEPPAGGTLAPKRVRAAVKKVTRRVPPIQKRADPPEPPAKRARTKAGASPSKLPHSRVAAIGDVTTATGPDPTRVYQLRYRVLPLEQVQPSHTDTLDPNPRYPKEIQPRLRDRAASRLQIRTMAQNLEPRALVLDYHSLDRGPMIIGPDFMVESGNGRIMALRAARKEFPDKYREYVAFLQESIGLYGIKPGDLERIEDPVLVRERLTEVDRVAFAEEANQSAALSMSPLEAALTDARRISNEALANLEVGDSQTVDQALQSPTNKSLVSGFLGKLPANERAALVDAAGRLNQTGLQRLKSALFAKVYPGDAGMRLTRAFVESLDPTLKNVEAAMFDSLPQMARAEGLVNSGSRAADLSIGQDLARVVDKLAALKAERMPVADFIRQASMIERDLAPTQEKVLLHLDQFGRSRKAIREFLRSYAEAVTASPHPDQGSLLASVTESKGDILARLMESQSKKASTAALFELIETRERLGMVADPGRRFPHWSQAGGKRGK